MGGSAVDIGAMPEFLANDAEYAEGGGMTLHSRLFTLLELQNEGAQFRWNVVSIPETLSNTSPSSNKRPVQGTSETVRSNPSPEDANAALDRIEIPPDVVARISQILTPGSSLIVSDYGLSRETGNDTDFIVVMP